MSQLSPQTQAILDAYNAGFARPVAVHHKPRIAAALRAAADQVMSPVSPPCEDFDEYAQGFLAAHVKYRSELLAIADELEDQTASATKLEDRLEALERQLNTLREAHLRLRYAVQNSPSDPTKFYWEQ